MSKNISQTDILNAFFRIYILLYIFYNKTEYRLKSRRKGNKTMKNVYEKPVVEEIRIQTEDILLVSGELEKASELYGNDKDWKISDLL